MGWLNRTIISNNPVTRVLGAPIHGVASSVAMVSEGLGMIFEGLLKFCIWLVVLLVEVVLIGVTVGVAAYFAVPHLQRLWVAVTNHFF